MSKAKRTNIEVRGTSIGILSQPHGDYIYAVFAVETDPGFAGRTWDKSDHLDAIEKFESHRAYRNGSLGRNSSFPRVLSLKERLGAMRVIRQDRENGEIL